MTLSDATQLQNRASESGKSTWLSANAGSGKTRVLTDRVARLLLKGISPQSVLCLTYTKAAASEMQNRLFKRLGAWAMLPDADLRKALQDLGETADVGLTHARTLFARAIETPGGLRIQTIHSFCASLLRRFPIEAGVSPHFIEMDEIGQSHLISDIIEDMADETAPEAIEALARHLTGEDAAALAKSVVIHRGAFQRPVTCDDVAAVFGLPAGADENLAIATAFEGSEAGLVRAVLPEIRKSTAKTMRTLAHALEELGPVTPSAKTLDTLAKLFLKADANVAKTGSIPTKSVQTALGPLCDELHSFMDRVAEAQNIRAALAATEKTLGLFTFATAFLPQYEHQKRLRGWMDFDDLIEKAEGLLSDPAAAAWVLFRLDGSFDHVLVDEAQDTSPAQWRIIDLLTQDLGSGIGVRPETRRTVFVVGDKKQSIYSFQGADPEAFDRMFEHFKSRLFPEGGLHKMQLEHSFRSARAILETADATFDSPAAEGLGRETRHRAFHETMPGRVDLWPIVPKPEKPEETAWYDPVDMPTPNHESVVLAEHIATEIRRLTEDETETVPCENGKFRRRIEPGDFLILVRSRSGAKEFFHKIIRACKARGLPIAGADRLRIGDELAVKDLRSLLAFLALPEDDLSLAEALRSPILGWSEEMLFKLAAQRGKAHLWQALRARKAEHQETYDILDDLRRQSDFMRPYDLLERILIRHDGRANLLARLGREAEDSIDELLNQALSYERQDIPSLTGFLAWLETDNSEIKREMDSTGNLVRVMTVHGAKGLEAPIVILPQTLSGKPQIRDQILLTESDLPLWKQRASEMPQAMIDARDAKARREFLEQQRLLYVAMTRAETWLIVCGAGDRPRTGDTWYDTVEAGLEKLGTEPREFPTGQGARYATGHWDAAPMAAAPKPDEPKPQLPGFFAKQATEPKIAQATLSPSELGGAKALAGDTAALSEDDAKRRGRQIHKLLETLPAYPRESWPEVATDLLAFGEDAAPEDVAKALCAEAAGVLEAPALAHVFAEDALTEVEITARIGRLEGRVVLGAIDRLIIEESRVLAVDFKSNEIVPERPALVPEGILRQMGAYAAALEKLYPGKTVETAIIWTRAAAFMPLSHETVISALDRTTTS